jgi:hypothetical protein
MMHRMIANWKALKGLAFTLAIMACVSYAGRADGIAGLPSGQILIMPTLAGDSKMQGNVVFGDFQLLSQYFGSGGSWDDGNFTFGSTVNFGDFQLLSQNFGANSSNLLNGTDPTPPAVTLSLVASDGSYTVYANDTSTNNVGIESFDINVVGSGGASVTSSYLDTPNNGSYGFIEYPNDGDNGIGITAAESTSDNWSGNIISGFGQTSGSGSERSWTQTSSGVQIASGTYSGSGALSVNVAAGGFIQTLNIVSDGQWSGPGNLSLAQVTGGSMNVKTIYVDDHATGTDNGTSWTNAYTSLPVALSAAAEIEAGGQTGVTIDVAQGTYYPTSNNSTVTNPTSTFTLANDVSIVGGFGGVENSSNPNSQGFTTILSGSSVSYHVVTASGVTSTSVLYALTITCGNADGTGANANGGGIYDTDGGPVIVECNISGNSAAADGGGIFVSGGGQIDKITDTSINSDYAYDGGGIFIAGSGAIESISNSQIDSDMAANHGGGIEGAGYNGGGIFVASDGEIKEITDTSINGDSAYSGGGIFICAGGGIDSISNSQIEEDTVTSVGGGIADGGYLVVTNCIISGDSATAVGDLLAGAGGIYLSRDSDATISYCTISGDSAEWGGGIGNYSDMATVIDCTFSDDRATEGGGAIYNLMGLTAIGCTFNGDEASFGGGISNYGAAYLTNCTFYHDSATLRGGAIDTGGNTLYATDCTISGDSATEAGGIYGSTYDSYLHLYGTIVAKNTGGDLAGNFQGSYNLIGDGSGGLSTGNNILGTSESPIDPLLSSLGNYGGPTETMALLPGSPAIGAGSTFAGITTDQRGYSRPSTSPDIGAYQTPGESGDFEMAGDDSDGISRSSSSGSNDLLDTRDGNQIVYSSQKQHRAPRAMLLLDGGYG